MKLIALLQHNFFKNTSWMMGEKIIRMGLNLFLMAAVANYLGSHQFGVYSYYITIIFFLMPLWSFGMDQILRNELTISKENKSAIIGTGIAFRFATAFIIFISTCLYYLLNIKSSAENPIILVILCISLSLKSFSVIELWFDTEIKSKYNVIARSCGFFTMAICQLLAIIYKAPLYIFALCFILEFLCSAILSTYFYLKKEESIIFLKFDLGLLKKLLKKSWPIFFSEMAVTCYMKVNIIILAMLMDKSSVGQLSIAVKLTDIWIFLPASICITLFSPIISALKNSSDISLYKKRNQDLYTSVTILALIIGTLVTLFAKDIIPLLFNAEYAKSIDVLVILIWSNLFVFWGFAQEPWEISKNLLKYRLVRVGSGAILNIILNFIFIKKWGLIGVAYASILSNLWTCCLFNLFLKETRELFVYQMNSFNIYKGIKSLMQISHPNE